MTTSQLSIYASTWKKCTRIWKIYYKFYIPILFRVLWKRISGRSVQWPLKFEVIMDVLQRLSIVYISSNHFFRNRNKELDISKVDRFLSAIEKGVKPVSAKVLILTRRQLIESMTDRNSRVCSDS